MNKPTLSETLQLMAKTHESRSETSRLRDIFDDVEKAIQKGVSRKAILEVLHQDGFTMSLKMFDKALYLIRKSKKQTVQVEKKLPQQPKKENTFKNEQAQGNGYRRRNDFNYNPSPDKSRIYEKE